MVYPCGLPLTIDKSKCALMLTRRDTQGVMSCELATYGIPLITSDLPVCKEIFRNVPNVSFISNDVDWEDLKSIYTKIVNIKEIHKISVFNYENTVKKEETFINSV